MATEESGSTRRGVRAGRKNAPQVVAATGKFWSDETEAAFLDQLAACCNVKMAAKAIGYSFTTLYWRRRRDPGFAERWQAALEQGYSRIEALLMSGAEDALSGRLPDPDTPIPAMTVKEAIDLLRLHQAAVRGRGYRAPGRPARVRTLDEVRASILAKVTAIKAARAAS